MRFLEYVWADNNFIFYIWLKFDVVLVHVCMNFGGNSTISCLTILWLQNMSQFVHSKILWLWVIHVQLVNFYVIYHEEYLLSTESFQFYDFLNQVPSPFTLDIHSFAFLFNILWHLLLHGVLILDHYSVVMSWCWLGCKLVNVFSKFDFWIIFIIVIKSFLIIHIIWHTYRILVTRIIIFLTVN